jgi:hypothetical protein
MQGSGLPCIFWRAPSRRNHNGPNPAKAIATGPGYSVFRANLIRAGEMRESESERAALIQSETIKAFPNHA